MEEEILEPVAVGVSTPSPAPAPVESPEDTNAFIARINAMTTGEEMLRHMRSLLLGRAARNLGYTFNRVIKVLTNQGLIPPDIPTTSYGIMKKDSSLLLVTCHPVSKNTWSFVTGEFGKILRHERMREHRTQPSEPND